MSANNVRIRPACAQDLPVLIALYADDPLGKGREQTDKGVTDRYRAAFEAIDQDPNHCLAVGEIDGTVVATLLLSYLPGLSRNGAWRAQIEAMRVSRDWRRAGIGRAMLEWAIDQAKTRKCDLVQLTSDVQRPDAHRFYERAGFSPSHVGFKKFI